MHEIVYVLKVPEDEEFQTQIGELIGASFLPDYVRLSTIAPLSNYGYTPGVEGAILAINDRGVIIGAVDDSEVPRALVPWTNIAYIAESGNLESAVAQDEG